MLYLGVRACCSSSWRTGAAGPSTAIRKSALLPFERLDICIYLCIQNAQQYMVPIGADLFGEPNMKPCIVDPM